MSVINLNLLSNYWLKADSQVSAATDRYRHRHWHWQWLTSVDTETKLKLPSIFCVFQKTKQKITFTFSFWSAVFQQSRNTLDTWFYKVQRLVLDSFTESVSGYNTSRCLLVLSFAEMRRGSRCELEFVIYLDEEQWLLHSVRMKPAACTDTSWWLQANGALLSLWVNPGGCNPLHWNVLTLRTVGSDLVWSSSRKAADILSGYRRKGSAATGDINNVLKIVIPLISHPLIPVVFLLWHVKMSIMQVVRYEARKYIFLLLCPHDSFSLSSFWKVSTSGRRHTYTNLRLLFTSNHCVWGS